MLKESNKIANEFNQYFTDIGPSLSNQINAKHNFKEYLHSPADSRLILQSIDEHKVMKIIEHLKNKTSTGTDGISNKLIKTAKNELIKPLTIIINQMLHTGIFPEPLKISKVVPLYTANDQMLLSNYRPIALLPSLSKIFEYVLLEQLTNYFVENNLLSPHQYGFRAKHSTELAALNIVDNLTYKLDSGLIPIKQLSNTKQKYYSNKIIECAGDTKMLHSITNKLLVDQHTQQLPSDDDDTHLANIFCDYFAQKIDNIRNNFTLTTETEETLPQDIKFDQFRPVSIDEIRKVITSYNSKSCELDPIPTWLLKLCIDELLPLLTSIINKSFEYGVFPIKFKQALIRPLLKKHNLDPEELKNYRPVSNLHLMSKIIEKIVAQRLEDHISIHSLHDPLQSAYRSNHSTETAIIKITNDIITSIDRGQCTILASLDLSAAFDTVDHDIFLKRLQSVYGFCGTALSWFKTYLQDRQYKVCINSSFSQQHTLKCGVPQGSVLGARMYTMYTEPMRRIIEKHNISYHSYADDTQLYIHCDNNEISIQAAITQLELCIADVCKWMTENALKLNEEKTDFIIFAAHTNQYSTPSLCIGESVINPSESIKILGVTLDNRLTMQKHITNTCQSSYMHIRKINSIRRYLSEQATLTLINSTVLIRLDYCNSVYVGLPQTSLHKLQLAQNTAARVASCTPRYHHITPILQQYNWLPIAQRCQLKLLVLTFKVLHREAPQYIIDLFHWYSPARPLRSSLTTSLVPNRNKTIRYGKRLIDTSTAALWNSLPNEIKCATNRIQFKKLIKLYIAL